MAIETFRATVGTTATLLYAHPKSEDVAGDYTSKAVDLCRTDPPPTKTVYVGGSAVSTTTGVRWSATPGVWHFDLEPGEALYAIVATGTEPIDVIVNGR